MSNKAHHKAYIEDGKIDTSEEGIHYWAREFRCSPKDLVHAISKIGSGYTILLLYLEMNRLIGEEDKESFSFNG